jgi:hypothetical protein
MQRALFNTDDPTGTSEFGGLADGQGVHVRHGFTSLGVAFAQLLAGPKQAAEVPAPTTL